jgi:hypothetical protein
VIGETFRASLVGLLQQITTELGALTTAVFFLMALEVRDKVLAGLICEASLLGLQTIISNLCFFTLCMFVS